MNRPTENKQPKTAAFSGSKQTPRIPVPLDGPERDTIHQLHRSTNISIARIMRMAVDKGLPLIVNNLHAATTQPA